ncbi:MAG: shikimate kinase [Salinibacterium sp.]|nr:shikimate kinase [Salinibacterium sp.]
MPSLRPRPLPVSERAVVVLIGAPGAGKTRTGKRLARLLDVPLIDTDRRIVESHGPIAEIFEKYGEPHFREIERDVVAAALREEAIVTLGGGAVLDPATQALLSELRVVQLTVSPEAVEARIAGGKRPLVKDGIGAWRALVQARQPIYDRLSQLTIDTSRRPLEGVARKIADWLDVQ